MKTILSAMENMRNGIGERHQRRPIPFEEFLKVLVEGPHQIVRNVFQTFNDMVTAYVGEGTDEYPNDPESISFVWYDCSRLFVEGSDNPFFADRLFANRLISHVGAMKTGAQQNKIYIFDGPPGCGKSTFLNNLLRRFEEYANTDEGLRYETVWRIDPKLLGGFKGSSTIPLFEKLSRLLENAAWEPSGYQADAAVDLAAPAAEDSDLQAALIADEVIEIPCPSHDNPLLMIPKALRRRFFDDLFENVEFKWKLFTEKEYNWVFRDIPCTICSSLYEALAAKADTPMDVFKMLYARPYQFNRRLGEGISVFNPGDKPLRNGILSNPILQKRINAVLKDSNLVKYIFSQYAKTNNGIYALMDVKTHNTERLTELHNIISEGVHKVEDIEENVNSLLIAVMNPEDKINVSDVQSFSDRIEYIKIPYVMDLNTEVEIYRNIFGAHIEDSFLPRVLHNFARVIISSRLKTRSEALLEWIGNPAKYRLYCDENLQLLKMEIYTGHIPSWLSEEDRSRLTAQRRRRIIAEAEKEGEQGFSGRDSIKIFNDFYTTYRRGDHLINMSTLNTFFTKSRKGLGKSIPLGFMDSLLRMYNYMVLQEVKESLYYYNEEQITRDILNYMFAVNFEPGTVQTCNYTGDRIEISIAFLESIENRLLDPQTEPEKRIKFRRDVQRDYTTTALTQEILAGGVAPEQTQLFQSLHDRYVHNLKEKVLEPFLQNENFRRALKDFNTESFRTYDKRIKADVAFLMDNLRRKYRYTDRGAKEVCMYVIDNRLAQKFS